MADPVGTISGLSSGVQWRDMVDQIMQIESQRKLSPVTARQAAVKKQATAWTDFQGVAAKFRDAANALRDSTSFDVFTAAATKSSSTSRDLVSATAAAGAAAGTYGVEVLALARAEKLSGNIVASSSAALNVASQFSLNGATVTVAATDSLIAVRDKINAANAGTSPSGVSATILASGAGARLVLTSDATGANGIETVDDAVGTLQSLGFVDGTRTANITAAGATQTNRLSSTTAAIATLLGVPLPTPSTIKVGGVVVNVDLAVDSLTTLAAKINAATANATSASVQSETVGGKTVYRLVTDAAVETDASVNLADSARALAALGFTRDGHAGIAQVVKSANTFFDANTGVAATGAALITDLQANGQSLGIAAGDSITINGTRGDGTAVTRTFTIAANSTLQDLLTSMNDAGAGFGFGARPAGASIAAGKLALTDGTAGDSQLAVAITVAKASGGTISLGGFSAANGTVGRSRQVAAGADAQVRVDGQVVSRATNTVTDAIAGVTLNVLAAEVGTSVNVTIARDVDGIVKSMQDMAAAYNAVRTFVTTETKSGGRLENDSTVRSMAASLTSALIANVTGLSGSYTTASLGGLQHDRAGVLSLDAATFKTALQANFDAIKRLFTLTGTPSDREVSFVSAGDKAQPTTTPYAVAITQAATLASVTGASWTTYATAGAPDTMAFTDAATGATGSITLANGDTIDTTVSRLNSLFNTTKMRLSATKTVDNRLQISASDYGTTGGFTIAYTPGAGGDGTAMLGLTAQAYAGLDVTGTINGFAATGRGQYLTGGTTDASEGLIVRYTGTTARAAGTVGLSLGVSGALQRIAAGIAVDNSGGAATHATAATTSADSFQTRINDIQTRLDARRAALTKQFIAMERAMAQAQAMGAALTAQINGLQASAR